MSIEDDIRAEEGWKAHVYPDSLGYATIGYGFLVDSRKGQGLPKEVADFWLRWVVLETEGELIKRWPPFFSQPNEVKRALLNMAYQMGVDGLLGFHQMLSALENEDRAEAAAQILDSKFHQQTPARAERMAGIIRGPDQVAA